MGSLLKTTMKATLALLLVLCGIGLSEAGFRCFFGDWACSSGCKVLGQSSGTCDDDGKCWCSERAISFAEFREMLTPSEFALCAAESTCTVHCQGQGKAYGRCNGWQCECLSTPPTEV